MPRYVNTFAPRSDIGRQFSGLAQTMFGTMDTPEDQANRLYREALTGKATAEADEIRERSAMRNPERIATIAATQAGVPVRSVKQYQDFRDNGIPYALPDFTPEQDNAVRSTLAALMTEPMLTGKTNYQQLMKGMETGSGLGREDQMLAGQIDPETVAAAMAAMAGKPTYDINSNVGFKPYGGPEDITMTPLAESMRQENLAQAGYSDAAAGYQRERSRGDTARITDGVIYNPQGTVNDPTVTTPVGQSRINKNNQPPAGAIDKWLSLSPADVDAINLRIDARNKENGVDMPIEMKQYIIGLSSNYSQAPESPYYGNLIGAFDAAYIDAMKESSTVMDDKDVESFTRQPLPYSRPASPVIAPVFQGPPHGQSMVDELPDASQLPDGTTADDDSTGKRFIVVKGAWQEVM